MGCWTEPSQGRISKKGHFLHSLDHSKSSRRAIRSSRGNWAKRRCLLQDAGQTALPGRKGENGRGQKPLKLSKGSGD